MTPVVQSQPYPAATVVSPFHSSNTTASSAAALPVHCLHMSTVVSPTVALAAVGSYHSDMTKLIDWRAGVGAATHTLMVGGTFSSSLSRQFRAGQHTSSNPSHHPAGVTAVQWSPLQTNVVATCTNGVALVWDIRQTSQPVMVLQADRMDSLFDGNDKRDRFVSKACAPIGSKLTSYPLASDAASRTTPRRANMTDHATNLVFDGTGQYLVTVGRILTVWDLMSRPSSPHARARYTLASSSSNRRAQQFYRPVLFWTGPNPQDRRMWTSAAGDHTATDTQKNHHNPASAMSVDAAVGHLGPIRAAMAFSQSHHNAASSSTVRSSLEPQLVSSANDGLILLWTKQKQRSPYTTSDNNNHAQYHKKKRPRRDINDIGDGEEDVDTW
jgi:WD40 repeat protein